MSLYLQPLKKYAQFSGRASRKEYWTFYLAVMLASFLAAIVCALAFIVHSYALTGLAVLLALVLVLGTLVPTFAVGVRRLHDRGMSAWWMLLCFVPYVGGIIIMVLYMLPGDNFENQYGPVPEECQEPLLNEPAPTA